MERQGRREEEDTDVKVLSKSYTVVEDNKSFKIKTPIAYLAARSRANDLLLRNSAPSSCRLRVVCHLPPSKVAIYAHLSRSVV